MVIQMRRLMVIAVALGFCLGAGEAAAQGKATSAKPEYITGGVGYFDLKPTEPSSNVQLEWGLGLKYWLFVPESSGAALAASDRTMVTAGGTHGGVGLELSLGESFIFTPSIAAGVAERNEIRDPTDPASGQIEIRTGVAAAYEFSNDWRLGATYFHVTNPSQDGTSLGTSGDVLNFTLAVPFGAK
ncbi:hypothetical protein N825_11720 [Skermanella stibiiresistens SB22]|uniref:Lipid A 3-O-deacylase n=2 Tax=Skermanella TaxID=204447 RepID=W9GY71_9PROT|nr:hypothetical protein N825_11720 [Skermanella stibiiresistens SB22]